MALHTLLYPRGSHLLDILVITHADVTLGVLSKIYYLPM